MYFQENVEIYISMVEFFCKTYEIYSKHIIISGGLSNESNQINGQDVTLI